jgi:hypothetical protein
MPAIKRRRIAFTIALLALVAVGGSSTDQGWSDTLGMFKPPRLWVGDGDVLLWVDTGSDRQYALDALALRYVGDYTRDSQVVEDIRGGYWCGTPVIEQWGKIPARDMTETALRQRARALVERRVGKGV